MQKGMLPKLKLGLTHLSLHPSWTIAMGIETWSGLASSALVLECHVSRVASSGVVSGALLSSALVSRPLSSSIRKHTAV